MVVNGKDFTMSLKNKFSKVNTTVDEDIQKLRNDIDRFRCNPDFRKKSFRSLGQTA